jgi:hypothetical protein
MNERSSQSPNRAMATSGADIVILNVYYTDARMLYLECVAGTQNASGTPEAWSLSLMFISTERTLHVLKLMIACLDYSSRTWLSGDTSSQSCHSVLGTNAALQGA